MKDKTARRICQWSPVWRVYIAMNLALLALLALSFAVIDWSVESGSFVIAVLGLVLVVGSIVLFGGMVLWCQKYQGVQTVE